MTVDDVKQVTTFTGNVIVTKGTLLIKAAKAVIVQDPEGYQYVTLYAAPGKLASMRQKLDGGPNLWMEGYGEKIEYDNKHEVAKFYTHARVKRMEGSVVTDDLMGNSLPMTASRNHTGPTIRRKASRNREPDGSRPLSNLVRKRLNNE